MVVVASSDEVGTGLADSVDQVLSQPWPLQV